MKVVTMLRTTVHNEFINITLFQVLYIAFIMTASLCLCGVVPALPAAYIAPYASSYSASVVNHAVAAPVAAPVAAAPLVAAAPAYPYAAAYSAPLVLGR